MKVAHVAPADLQFLTETGLHRAKSRYHLVLAHVAKHYDDYREFYTQRAEEGHYVIVDNGAYEFSVTGDFAETIHCTEQMRAQEIVLPDDMKSATNTIEIFQDGMELLRKEYGSHYRPPYVKSFMVAPHGSHPTIWKGCLRQMLEVIDASFTAINMPTIAIGIAEKDGIALTGGSRLPLIDIVYDVWRYMQLASPKFVDRLPEIHLLGMTEHLEEFYNPYIYQRVRGVDGSKLIVYGMNGLNVTKFVVRELNDPTCVASYPGRPPDYFGLTKWAKQRSTTQTIIRENVARWQHVDPEPVDI